MNSFCCNFVYSYHSKHINSPKSVISKRRISQNNNLNSKFITMNFTSVSFLLIFHLCLGSGVSSVWNTHNKWKTSVIYMWPLFNCCFEIRKNGSIILIKVVDAWSSMAVAKKKWTIWLRFDQNPSLFIIIYTWNFVHTIHEHICNFHRANDEILSQLILPQII